MHLSKHVTSVKVQNSGNLGIPQWKVQMGVCSSPVYPVPAPGKYPWHPLFKVVPQLSPDSISAQVYQMDKITSRLS